VVADYLKPGRQALRVLLRRLGAGGAARVGHPANATRIAATPTEDYRTVLATSTKAIFLAAGRSCWPSFAGPAGRGARSRHPAHRRPGGAVSSAARPPWSQVSSSVCRVHSDPTRSCDTPEEIEHRCGSRAAQSRCSSRRRGKRCRGSAEVRPEAWEPRCECCSGECVDL